MLIASCKANPNPPSTPAAETGTSPEEQREADQAETRERNKNEPPLTREELRAMMEDPTHKPHLKLWRDNRSYYALLEISEGIIEPGIGRLRRQDIEELLGKGGTGYPNSNGRVLEYAGDRQIPYGGHMLVSFDGANVVERVDWVSE